MAPDPSPALGRLQDANQFEIAGPIAVSFTRAGITGAPLLSYRDAEIDRSFSGAEISVVPTPAGDVVTVTVESVVDAFERRFGLVVPDVRLSGGESVQVELLGIETVDRSDAFVLPPGPSGALQTHRVHQLGGVARFVLA